MTQTQTHRESKQRVCEFAVWRGIKLSADTIKSGIHTRKSGIYTTLPAGTKTGPNKRSHLNCSLLSLSQNVHTEISAPIKLHAGEAQGHGSGPRGRQEAQQAAQQPRRQAARLRLRRVDANANLRLRRCLQKPSIQSRWPHSLDLSKCVVWPFDA